MRQPVVIQLVWVIALGQVLAGCGSGTALPTVSLPSTLTPAAVPSPSPTALPMPTPIDVSFEDICSQGPRRVAIRGQLAILPLQMICGDSCRIRLQWPNSDDRILPIMLNVGSGENQMEPLPTQYDDSDLRIHGADGSTFGVESEVLLTGWTIPYVAGGILDSDLPKGSLMDCLLVVELVSAQR
jgi:hypothetical protein